MNMNDPSRDNDDKGRKHTHMKRARKTLSRSSSCVSRDRSPTFMWYCYFVLVAQVTSRSCAFAWAGAGAAAAAATGNGRLRGVIVAPITASASANDASGLCMSRLEPAIRQRQWKAREPPSMFLGGKFPHTQSIALLPVALRKRRAGSGKGKTSGASESLDRRVLGFDVLSLYATPSNVNMKTWKSADSGVSDARSFFSSPAATMDIDWISPVSDPSASFAPSQSVGLPWTPTRARIESLKVVELKQACVERGLEKSGNKAALQERLWNWVVDQQYQNQVKITGDFLTRYFEDSASATSIQQPSAEDAVGRYSTSTPNSLADWARNVDIEPLLQKRKEIHRQKREGRPVPKRQTLEPSGQHQRPATAEYLKSLARALRAPSSPFASNIKVKELYTASKQADQLGERIVAIDLLQTLLRVTPSDARVYRRLARMYTEQGDFCKARETLHAGLQIQDQNPWLWHGLGQLERKHGTNHLAREYFEKAIECDPTFAQSYHALGSMEHSQGNIAKATRIIKQGLEYCPTNHRLWHACGDVYRAAQMLQDAERSYRRALKHGPPMSHCFAYSALAAVAYEQGQTDSARSWLLKALRINNGRHAQGWVALAQLEESEDRIQKAQLICTSAIAQYERGLVEARQRYLRNNGQMSSVQSPTGFNSTNSVEITNQLLRSVPRYRSGDKFVHVYRNWARLEERHGTFESVDRVYERARVAFPEEYKLLLSWAQYHSNRFSYERARTIYQEACSKVGNRHADPYRMSAEFEMSLSNFQDARKILFLGAQAVMKSSIEEREDRKGLPELLHSWAVCEWHLGNLDRAELLFDNALRLVETGDGRSRLRSYILYSVASLKQQRGKLYFAQHCLALALKENSFPGGNGKLWALWADIARDTKNEKLENECLAQYSLAEETKAKQDEYLPLLNARSSSEVSSAVKPNVENLLSRDPWQVKLFRHGSEPTARTFKSVKLPLELTSHVVEEMSS